MAHPGTGITLIGNGQTVTYLKPPGLDQWNLYPTIDFTAADPSYPGTLALGLPEGAPGWSNHLNNQNWHLNNVMADGWYPGHEAFGQVKLEGPYDGTVTIDYGVSLSFGHVTLGTVDGGAYVLNGASKVDNYSTFTAYGGRYGPMGDGDWFNVNGTMSVTNHSIADFDNATLAGTGTIHVSSSGTVDVNHIIAGLHMNVDKGGTLFLHNPNSAGRINLAAGGAVFVAGASDAMKEVFHEATGTLDLLNRSGVQVASLKFAPGSHEYTSAASFHGGLLEITTNHAMVGNLHTTFVS